LLLQPVRLSGSFLYPKAGIQSITQMVYIGGAAVRRVVRPGCINRRLFSLARCVSVSGKTKKSGMLGSEAYAYWYWYGRIFGVLWARHDSSRRCLQHSWSWRDHW